MPTCSAGSRDEKLENILKTQGINFARGKPNGDSVTCDRFDFELAKRIAAHV